MNVFYLDRDPVICAKYHCDRHVVKMILESAQLLCSVINEYANEQITPYKTTHRNHPCTIWVKQSIHNALWLYDLTEALNDEFMFRFDKKVEHKSYQMLREANIRNLLYYYLPDSPQTEPALAMPEYCKLSDPVESYRLYYTLEKQHLLKYTRRELPKWL